MGRETQKAYGSRLVIMSIINNTADDAKVMKVFGLTDPTSLPTARGIKPNSFNAEKGTFELYIVKDQPLTGFGKEHFEALAKNSAWPIKSTLEKLPIAASQIVDPRGF